MERVASTVGFSSGNVHFTDLDYADDVVLLAHAMDDLRSYRPRGLRSNSVTTWPTYILAEDEKKNLGAGGPTSNLLICGQSVEEVAEFTYLGSVQSTTGRCQPDILRRIGIASRLHCHAVYEQSLATVSASTADCRLYQTCILSILLYGSEAWTLLQEDLRKLEAFHMRCQRMILGIHWHDFIRNTEVVNTTNLPCIRDIITRRRNLLFGHVVRLDAHTPAHRALSQVAAIRTGSCPPGWRRRTGRPRNWWLQQIADGTPLGIRAE